MITFLRSFLLNLGIATVFVFPLFAFALIVYAAINYPNEFSVVASFVAFFFLGCYSFKRLYRRY